MLCVSSSPTYPVFLRSLLQTPVLNQKELGIAMLPSSPRKYTLTACLSAYFHLHLNWTKQRKAKSSTVKDRFNSYILYHVSSTIFRCGEWSSYSRNYSLSQIALAAANNGVESWLTSSTGLSYLSMCNDKDCLRVCYIIQYRHTAQTRRIRKNAKINVW